MDRTPQAVNELARILRDWFDTNRNAVDASAVATFEH